MTQVTLPLPRQAAGSALRAPSRTPVRFKNSMRIPTWPNSVTRSTGNANSLSQASSTSTDGSATQHNSSGQNGSNNYSQSQTTQTINGVASVTSFEKDSSNQESSAQHADGTSPTDSFTSDSSANSTNVEHEDGNDTTQNFSVSSTSSTTSKYHDQASSSSQTTTDGKPGSTASADLGSGTSTTDSSSTSGTSLQAAGTITSGAVNYSNYNYQNTSTINYNYNASGTYGSLNVNASATSTCSVIGAGQSAVATNSISGGWGFTYQYGNLPPVPGGGPYNFSVTYPVALSVQSMTTQGAAGTWSWVVSQTSSAWSSISNAALQFVQTVWTTLQNGWSWIVSTAGSVWSWIVNSASSAWNWTVSTASSAWQYVVTLGKAAGEGIADGAVMVANGFTLGLIPSLSAKANALRGVYGDGVFWTCIIMGGVAGTALVLAATMATGGMGPAAALGIMGTGAAIGVALDAGHQIAQMADGEQPWWEFNYQELGQAGMLGAYMAPLAPLACAAPAIVPALTALGVANGVQEIMNGEGWTGAYDIATSLILFKLARGSCFAAGTPLLTPTGDKPIEQFQPATGF